MVISSHARRYLVAAIYISLSTVRSFAYNEPRAFTPFDSLLNRFASVEARSRSHRPNTGFQSFDRKNIGRFLCWKFRRIVLLKVTIPFSRCESVEEQGRLFGKQKWKNRELRGKEEASFLAFLVAEGRGNRDRSSGREDRRKSERLVGGFTF